MVRTNFLTAARTAAAIRVSLEKNDDEAADRLVTELLGWVIGAEGNIPVGVLEQPASTGDVRYDTLLAVGLAYALTVRGRPVAPWMEDVAPLAREWLWDGDDVASSDFRAYIRRNTPSMFLEKGLLLRDADIRTM